MGCLCLLDLLLTFGVIRRLREHTSMLTAAEGTIESYVGLRAGESPEPFSAVTISGEEVAGAAGLRMVAFFSSWCAACPEQVPPFVEYLSRHRIGRDSVLAVVAGDSSTPPPYLDRLAEVAQACVVQEDGDIAKAFKASLDSRRSACLTPMVSWPASGYDISALPEPARV